MSVKPEEIDLRSPVLESCTHQCCVTFYQPENQSPFDIIHDRTVFPFSFGSSSRQNSPWRAMQIIFKVVEHVQPRANSILSRYFSLIPLILLIFLVSTNLLQKLVLQREKKKKIAGITSGKFLLTAVVKGWHTVLIYN